MAFKKASAQSECTTCRLNYPAESCISPSYPLTGACEARPQHWSVQSEWGHYWPANERQNKTGVRFTLLFWAVLCGADKATMLWCEGTMVAGRGSASARGQVSDVAFSLWSQLDMHDSRHFHVTGYSSRLAMALLKFCGRGDETLHEWVWDGVLVPWSCAGGGGRD